MLYSSTGQLALDILLGRNDQNAETNFADCGLSELKDRIARAEVYCPLVAMVRDVIEYQEYREKIKVPREDMYALLAYHALVAMLSTEQSLLKLHATTVTRHIVPGIDSSK